MLCVFRFDCWIHSSIFFPCFFTEKVAGEFPFLSVKKAKKDRYGKGREERLTALGPFGLKGLKGIVLKTSGPLWYFPKPQG